MSRETQTKAVIRYLENRNYKFSKFLGKGGFADIIGVLDPAGRHVAVKIVQKKDLWGIEDQYWPRLRHPHIIEVYDVITVKDLNVKLYIMPVLPRALDEVVQSKEFRNDPDSFNRIKKWSLQILSAIEHLHAIGLAHMDIKTDNVLIDSKDNAILADFTGLNFINNPIYRLISPIVFHSPECFVHDANKNIRGESFDMWSYGILTLNIMTGHYFAKKAQFSTCFTSWSTHLKPILQKALKESKFEKLMRNSFPKAQLSSSDVHLARHFIHFILNEKPGERPSAVRVRHHLLMKTISNPFKKDSLHVSKSNPFKKDENNLGRNSRGEDSSSKMKTENCLTGLTQNKDERIRITTLKIRVRLKGNGRERDRLKNTGNNK